MKQLLGSNIIVTCWIVLVVMLAGACRGEEKSESELAAEALDRGLQAHVAGDLDKAAGEYRTSLDHDPRNKFAFYNLGVIEQSAGRTQEAENNYRLALNIDSNYTPALFNLAILRASLGSTQEAIDLYRHVVELEPDNAGAHLNLGIALHQMNQQAEGDAELLRASELDPTLAIPSFETPEPSIDPQETASPTP